MIQGKRVLIVLVACLGLIAASCVTDTSGVPLVGAQCTDPPTLTPGALLSGCNLTGAALAGVDLTGADLRGANLTGADLTGANLTDADLTGANLTNANLTGANLTGAVLAGAILLGALFVNALLGGTDFGFGTVFGPNGNGGSNAPTGGSCVGPYCPGYNEVQSPSGPGRLICEPDVGGLLGPMGPEDIFIVTTSGQLEDMGSRSVVTDSATSFRGATFDFSNDPDGNGTGLLRGLDLRSADFTDATFIDTYLACKVADGARFTRAQFLPGPSGTSGFFHVSMRQAELTDTKLVNQYFCDTDFTDATMPGVAIGGASLTSCPELLPADDFNDLPDDLIKFDGADMTGAEIGLLANPSATYPAENPGARITALGIEADKHSPGSTRKHSTFRGTTLDGAHLEGVWLASADFTGASADGVQVTANPLFPNRFDDVIFGTGWTNTSWSGAVDFDGATCPDGSTGSDSNPCFAVAP